MADIPTIAEYIYRRASQLGVDPNLALGIASREGLNERTISSPTFGNADTRGYSFGPFQLFSASRDPRRIAPGGMAYEFQQRFGAAPSAENWKQQVDFSLERMRGGTQPWYAVRDAGGPQRITEIGRAEATRFGLGLPPNEPTEAVTPPPPPRAAAAEPAAEPVYGTDLGTSLRRLGNWIAPDLVEAATPLTPDQIAEEKKRNLALDDLGQARRGFLAMGSLGQQQELPQPALRGQVVGPRPFQPLTMQRRRGLLE